MAGGNLSEILDALRIIVHALQSGSRSSLEKVGLTGAQLFVLEKLQEADSMSVSEVAEATHTGQSAVSIVVSKLVKKGLVSRERSTDDARVQRLSITKRGFAKLESAPETAQDRLVRGLKKLPGEARVALAGTLRQLIVDAGFSNVQAEFFLETGVKTRG